MDFSFSPESDDAAALAAQILADKALSPRLWDDLVEAGLTTLALPEADGGAGLGVIELCRVLVEIGKHAVPTPLTVHGPAAMVVAEFGTVEQKQQWLASDRVLTVAITAPVDAPEVTADGDRLTGVKTLVRAGLSADAALVTVGEDVYLADLAEADRQEQRTSDGDVSALITFSGTPAERLAGAASRLVELATVCAAAEQYGVTEGTLKVTADYAKTREQFDRPIGTFQAVSQRLADGYIDVLCQRLTLWQAAWRLAEGLPAATEVAVAKFWAAEAGHRLAHTTVHIHGGVGIDLDGTAHRYFTAGKRFEFALGGATEQALRIGEALAAG